MGKLPQEQGGPQQHRLRIHHRAPRGGPPHDGGDGADHGPHPGIPFRPRLHVRVQSRVQPNVPDAQQSRDGIGAPREQRPPGAPRQASQSRGAFGGDGAGDQGTVRRPFHLRISVGFQDLVEGGGGRGAAGGAERGGEEDGEGGSGDGGGTGGEEAEGGGGDD